MAQSHYFATNPHPPAAMLPFGVSNGPPTSSTLSAREPKPPSTITTTQRRDHSGPSPIDCFLNSEPDPNPPSPLTATTQEPISAITDMIQDATHSLIEYLAFTQMDPSTMGDADKQRLGKALDSLKCVCEVTRSPGMIDAQTEDAVCSSNTSILRPPYASYPVKEPVSNGNRPTRRQEPLPDLVPDGASNKPAFRPRRLASSPGAIHNAGLTEAKIAGIPIIFLPPPPSISARNSKTTSQTDTPESTSDTESVSTPTTPITSRRRRSNTRWCSDDWTFFKSQVAQHGTQFASIWRLHGPNGTESTTLAKFTKAQLKGKWTAYMRKLRLAAQGPRGATKLVDPFRRMGSAETPMRS